MRAISVIMVITAAASAAWAFAVPLIMRLPRARKRYHTMDDRKLIELNVSARMMRKSSLALAILGPIPLLVTIWFIHERELATFFVCAMVLMASGGVSGWVLFTEMLRITTSEIEYRKFQKDKEKERDITQQGNAS